MGDAPLVLFPKNASNVFGEDKVSGVAARGVLGEAVAEFGKVEVGEEWFTGAEQARRDGEMEIVNEAISEELADRRDAAANTDVFPISCGYGLFKSRVDAIRDEMKRGAAGHRDRAASVSRQDNDGHVIGGIVAPPTFPVFVGPRAADRPKHVAPQNPGADVFKAARGEVVVQAGDSTVSPSHALKRARRKEPSVQGHAADAQGIFETLVKACAVAIQGNTEATDDNFRHKGHQEPGALPSGRQENHEGIAKIWQELGLADRFPERQFGFEIQLQDVELFNAGLRRRGKEMRYDLFSGLPRTDLCGNPGGR